MNKNKKQIKFKAVYKCRCGCEIIKNGIEHFNNTYKIICPFCEKNIFPNELKGYDNYLEEKKGSEEECQSQQ